MSELQTIRRVTVYADSVLEQPLLDQFIHLGSTGYSVVECRGKGRHEIVEGPFSGIVRVRIELLVRPEVADKIMAYLSRPEFKRRAVAACVETVQVPADDPF